MSASSINYTAQYEAVLPTRIQWDAQDCTNCAIATAMELRGILTGQPVVQLSQLFLDYLQHSYAGMQPPYNINAGGSSTFAASLAQTTGVCSEYLWPISMIGNDDYQLTVSAVNASPTPACYQDAPFHVITEWSGFPYYSTQAAMIASIQSLLAAGYPFTAAILPTLSHELCVVGYDLIAGGVFTLDSHAWPQEVFRPWEQLQPRTVIKGVKFSTPTTQRIITSAQVLSLQQLAAQLPPATDLTYMTNTTTVDAAFIAQLQGLASQFGSVAPPPIANNLLVNGSFESPSLPAGTFQYQWQFTTPPNGWSFTGGSGIQSNNSAWGASPDTEGSQSALIQGAVSAITQAFLVQTTGTLTLQFYAARRGTQSNPLKITLDGVAVTTVVPAGAAWQVFNVPLGTVSNGTHKIAFTGTGAGDVTTFLDAVVIG